MRIIDVGCGLRAHGRLPCVDCCSDVSDASHDRAIPQIKCNDEFEINEEALNRFPNVQTGQGMGEICNNV